MSRADTRVEASTSLGQGNPHCRNDGVPCAPNGAGGCVACDKFRDLRIK
jgi:hypothetical protein